MAKIHLYLKDGTENEVEATAFSFSDGFLIFSSVTGYFAPVEINAIRKLVFEDVVGITDLANKQVKLYPNPAQNFIQLSGITNIPFEICSIEGKLIQSGFYTDHDIIDISNLPKGFYVVKVKNSTLKLVKL
jgi:hypothetical protein